MNREEILEYVNKKYHTIAEYMWDKFPEYAVFKNGKSKWYGIIMNLPKNKLGLEESGMVDILNVKCLPELIGSLRMSKGFMKAYHMNKEHWITIILDGSVPSEKIKNLIDLSYELVNK